MPQASSLDALISRYGGQVEPSAPVTRAGAARPVDVEALLKKHGAEVEPPPAPVDVLLQKHGATVEPKPPLHAGGVTDPGSVMVTRNTRLEPAPGPLVDAYRAAKASLSRIGSKILAPTLPESFVTNTVKAMDALEAMELGRARPAAPARIGEDQPETPADPVGDAMARGFTRGATEATVRMTREMSNPLMLGLTAAGVTQAVILKRIRDTAQSIPKIEEALVAAKDLKATGQLAELSTELVDSVARLRDLERLRAAVSTAEAATGAGFTLEGAVNLVQAPTFVEKAFAVTQMAGGAAMALGGAAWARTARAGAREAEGFVEGAREASARQGRPAETPAPDVVRTPPAGELTGRVETPPPVARVVPIPSPPPGAPGAPAASVRVRPIEDVTRAEFERLKAEQLAAIEHRPPGQHDVPDTPEARAFEAERQAAERRAVEGVSPTGVERRAAPAAPIEAIAEKHGGVIEPGPPPQSVARYNPLERPTEAGFEQELYDVSTAAESSDRLARTAAAIRNKWRQGEIDEAEARRLYREVQEIDFASASARAVTSGQAPTAAPVSDAGRQPTITYNQARGSVEIKFSGKPDIAVRAGLKKAGYRWAKSTGVWYRRAQGLDETAAVAHARKAIGLQEPAAAVPPPPAEASVTKGPTPQVEAIPGTSVRLPSFATSQYAKKEPSERDPSGKVVSDGPPAPKQWTELGPNADGQPVFEDAKGVRSVVVNGVRRTEPVSLRPTRAGVETSAVDHTGTEWQLATEAAQAPPTEAQPETASTIAEYEETATAHRNGETSDAVLAVAAVQAFRSAPAHIGKVPTPDLERLRDAIPAALEETVEDDDGLVIDDDRERDDVEALGPKIERELLRRAGQQELGFGDRPAAKDPVAAAVDNLRTAIEQQVREEIGAPVASARAEAQNEAEKPDDATPAPRDREPLAGAPSADGEGARGAGAVTDGRQPRRDIDRGRGERRDSERNAGARSAGDVPGRVGVPAERGRDADLAGRPEPRDLRLTVADDVAVGGPKQRLTQNLAAIKALKAVEAEGRPATPEEQQVLVKYVGWGGLSNAFNPKHKDYSADLREQLTDEEYAAARASTPNAHYTSLPVINAMYDGLARLGVAGPLRMLEPAAGVGHFLGMMPTELATNAARHAVELDSITGRIAAALYPNVNVQVTGFQDAALPKGSFDLVISNVPFGNYQVADKTFKGRPKALTSSIHNYYFAKALDLTRPGGIVAFITSHFTMDAQDPTVREYLAQRANLLGAIRLPNTAFKANAGTEVVTDIIFLQKTDTPRNPETWVPIDTQFLGDDRTPVRVNRYFTHNPEMVLGKPALTGSMHRDNEYTVEPTGDLVAQLRDAIKELPARVYEPPTTKATRPTRDQQLPTPARVAVPAEAREGSWFQDANGQLYIRERGSAVAITDLTKPEISRIKGLLAVRDALRVAMKTMLSPTATDKQVKDAQRALTVSYDAFVRAHGYIAKRHNYRSLREDPDVYTLLALEEWKPKADKPEKAAIFRTRTLRPHVPVQSVGTPKEALLVSLNETGRVDWSRMADLTGQSASDLQAALEGLVYHDPGTDTWEQADRYLSGNVKAKLKAAKAAAKKDPAYAANVAALERVQPADLEPTDIAIRLGSPWVPPDVIDAFADHLGLRGLTFRYSPAMAKWAANTTRFHGGASVQNTAQWGTERKHADALLLASLNLGDPLVYDTVRDPQTGSEKQVVNQKDTLAAREKQEAIAQEFRSWVWEQPERAARLTTIYNDTMNTMRLWEPDGSHLSLPGTNPAITFRPHQKNFIWRGLQQPNALAHHVVGAGKTYAGIALALEKRRLGLARKPMVVVPNHLVQQWARDILKLYPAARVLASTKNDFEPGNRKRFLNRIATGDWDLVVVPMSHFGMIEVSAETFNAHVKRELAAYEAELKRAREEAGKNDPTVKELEKSKLNLEGKLRTTKERQKKDEDVITFERLGVDMLLVDEAHNFKKLGFPTKMTRVAGVPAGPGSQRAFDLAIKSGYLAKANPTGGTVFLTGTPISNTMAEMFVLMRYLAHAGLLERGIGQFDGWAATFGEKVTAFEISPTGRGFRQKTRFAKFTNLPELVQMYRAFADVQTADMLKLPTPPLKGGKADVTTVAATPALDEYVEDLLERFAAVLGLDGRQKPDPRVDNPLKITTDGRKAALDLRLVGLEQPPGGKVDAAADSIKATYDRYAKQKGTQLVFADLGTPSERKKAVDIGEFTVYDALRDALVARGIPRDHITFIQEANTDARKQALFDAMNAGDVRVLIGSSETMGAGMNVQRRLVKLHHLDAPWRPSDIEQREGRILRQGNGFLDPESGFYDPDFEVEIQTYVTERSFDAYLWQLLENKARFIRQALKGDLTSRETDDADDVVLNFAQAKGAASGNPAIMEHAKTQSDVQRLEASEANHDRRKWRLQRELASLPEQIAATKSALANVTTLRDAATMPADRKDFAIEIGGQALRGKEAAEAIVAKFEASRTGPRRQLDQYHYVTKDVAIGRAGGLDVRGYYAISNVYDPPQVVAKWVIAAGDATLEKPAATGAGALNSLAIFIENDPQKAVDRYTQELATLESSLAVAKTEAAKPFPNADKLKTLRARLKELEQQLNLDAKGRAEEAAKAGVIEQTAEEVKADKATEREDDDGDDVADDLGPFGATLSRPSDRGRVSSDASVGTTTAAAPASRSSQPPPSAPTGLSQINPIEFPELVDLARALQKVPGIAAAFRKAEKRGEFRGLKGIRLAADLFKPGQEYQLAKTLAHELGHLVDWLPHQSLKRGNLLGRLQSLLRFLKHEFTTPAGDTIRNKDVKAELIAFSAVWRPWNRDDAPPGLVRYRDSARELYADALSGLLVNPGELETHAPTFYRVFFELLDAKADVKAAYFDLQELLAGTREDLVARRRAGVRRMFEEGDTTALDLERRRLAALGERARNLWFQLKTDLADSNYAFIDRVVQLEKQGTRLPEDHDPRYLLEERRHLGALQKAFVERHFAPLFKEATEADIAWHAVGEALFYERIIAGDRSELANPRGLSQTDAEELYEALKRELGTARTRTLTDLVTRFRAAVKEVLTHSEATHLYTPELRAEMAKNPAYGTYRVVEHMSDRVTSRVYRQVGTLKDIANVANSTILKTLVTLRALEHNRVKRESLAFLAQHFAGDIQPARMVWNGRTHVPAPPKEDTLRLVTFYQGGKLVGRYVDRYIADSLENETIGQNLAVVQLLRTVNSGFFRPVFTTFNLGFQGFNFFRDFGRFWKNVPGMTLRRALRRYVEAVPLAKLRAFGLPAGRPLTPKEVQAYKDYLDGESSRILSFTMNDMNTARTVEDSEIEDIIARTGVAGFGMPPKSWLRKPIHALLAKIKELGDFIETIPKAAAIYEFKGAGSISAIPPSTRSLIRRKVGSPDFKMRGRMTPISNEVFLFSNAILQAVRADFEVATEPQTRAGFWWKTVKANLLPKVLMWAALAGLLGETLRRLMQRTTEYDRTNYVVLPLGEDARGQTLYLRVPQDDSGRLIGGLFWKLLQLARGEQAAVSSLAQVVDYTAGQFPGVSPSITTTKDVAAFAAGQNPYDEFRGRNVFTEDEWKARDWRTVKKFLGWEFQNLGGGIVWKFYPGEDRPREQTTGQKILELPVISNIVGRFVRITNYGETERLRRAGANVQREEARARLTEREAIADAIRQLQAPASYSDDGTVVSRELAVTRAAVRIAAQLYAGDRAEAMRRVPELKQMLSRGLLRGGNDPVIGALLSATTNKQKLAILQQAIRDGQIRRPAVVGQ